MSSSLLEDVTLRQTAGRLYSHYVKTKQKAPRAFRGDLYAYACLVALSLDDRFDFSVNDAEIEVIHAFAVDEELTQDS